MTLFLSYYIGWLWNVMEVSSTKSMDQILYIIYPCHIVNVTSWYYEYIIQL